MTFSSRHLLAPLCAASRAVSQRDTGTTVAKLSGLPSGAGTQSGTVLPPWTPAQLKTRGVICPTLRRELRWAGRLSMASSCCYFSPRLDPGNHLPICSSLAVMLSHAVLSQPLYLGCRGKWECVASSYELLPPSGQTQRHEISVGGAVRSVWSARDFVFAFSIRQLYLCY